MSEIGDELRKVADEWDVTPLYALADRIDAEMVELPKDADGKPMHLRDKIYDLNGYEHAVISLNLYNDLGVPTWMVGIGFGNEVSPRDLTHTRPDSLERIADELDEWRFEHMHDLVADGLNDLRLFAERIRSLAERETGDE